MIKSDDYAKFWHNVKYKKCQNVEKSVERLDYRVARGYFLAAVVTFSLECDPAKYGNKISCAYFSSAGHTMGGTLD